jgi:hypothetical protein
MPGQIWAVAEAASKKEHISAESDATGYAAGIMTWLLAGSVFAAVKLGVSEMPPLDLLLLAGADFGARSGAARGWAC